MAPGGETGCALDLAELQAYVDGSGELRAALGVPRGARLELRPFAQGEYNANFAFDLDPTSAPGAAAHRLLLRVNLGSQMHLDDQIGYEMAALRLLEPCGRTPRALYVDGSRTRLPFGVGVEERLDGRPLRYETDLAEAARILADVHALQVPAGCGLVAPAHPLADVVAECAALFSVYRGWPGADPAVLRRVDGWFETARGLAADGAAAGRRHVVNTELNAGNFLINEGARSYLVDWEKPVLGEVEQDLAHFLAPTTTFWRTDTVLGRREMEGFVEEYARAVDGRFAFDGFGARLDAYLVATCLRGVTWCAMALTEYCSGARPLTSAATRAKIEAYLEPAFLDDVGRTYFAG